MVIAPADPTVAPPPVPPLVTPMLMLTCRPPLTPSLPDAPPIEPAPFPPPPPPPEPPELLPPGPEPPILPPSPDDTVSPPPELHVPEQGLLSGSQISSFPSTVQPLVVVARTVMSPIWVPAVTTPLVSILQPRL